MIQVCDVCGAVYPEEFIASWGRSKESDGMGPYPRCVNLVPNPYAPPPMKDMGGGRSIIAIDSKTGQPEMPLQICGGNLIREDRDAPRSELLLVPTEIEPGRRV